jgi:hypothetical protein
VFRFSLRSKLESYIERPIHAVRFEALPEVAMKIDAVCDVAMKIDAVCGVAACSLLSVQQLLVELCSYILKTKGLHSSETSVSIYRIEQCRLLGCGGV